MVQNGNQVHVPVLDTVETKNDDAIDSNVSSETGTIITLAKEQNLNLNFEVRIVSNDASSDPKKGGYATENITVSKFTQYRRRTIVVSDEKYENDYDNSRSIGLFLMQWNVSHLELGHIQDPCIFHLKERNIQKMVMLIMKIMGY